MSYHQLSQQKESVIKMNKQQYYLSKLAEEAAELAQAAMKCAQFGMDEMHPVTLQTNLEALNKEFADVVACTFLVAETDERVAIDPDDETLEMKWAKVEKYREIAVKLGKTYD
jgi:NTP pyrophosphatase (non-canonical NTP hydrolase)